MCEICRRFRCPSGCPNAPEPAVFGKCDECGAKIYDGDEYYKIGHHKYCEACVLGGFRTAEVQYEW